MRSNLFKYHTTMADPAYAAYHLNVAIALHDKTLKTYEEYKKLCRHNGVFYYNEECWNTHIAQYPLPVQLTDDEYEMSLTHTS